MASGESLEQLVERLERVVAPLGLVVTRPEPQLLENGKIDAEFDVIVEGQIGSTQIRWLIECRDRPSEGPAPASWIEQLLGRRQRFNFDKVIAVSTTGFSEPAERFAEKCGITLRTVRRLEDVADGFFVQRIRFCLFEIQVIGACRFWKIDGSEIVVESGIRLPRIRLVREDHGLEPIVSLVWRFLSHAVAWREKWNSTQFTWEAPNNEYVIELDDSERSIVRQIECPIRVLVEEVDDAVPVQSIYEESGREIARESDFRLCSTPGEILVKLSFGYQAHTDKYVMSVRYLEATPTSYSSHVMVIRPNGFQNDSVTFPLDELVFTALKTPQAE